MQSKVTAFSFEHTIGETSEITGLTMRAIRYYERMGVLRPRRDGNGCRVYGPQDLAVLEVVVTLRRTGLRIAEIRDILRASSAVQRSALTMERLGVQLRLLSEARERTEAALVNVNQMWSTLADLVPAAPPEPATPDHEPANLAFSRPRGRGLKLGAGFGERR